MRTTRTATRYAAAAVTAAAVLTLTACGSGDDAGSAKPVADVSGGNTKPGVVLDTPKEKPDLVLTDTAGEKFDLAAETAGKPTLLFFGYTNCPDVCPTTMSDLALAKQKLAPAEQKKLQVVMVSTDPERDTPRRMRTWLDAMDKDFIGLTGDFTAIEKAAKSVGVHVDKPVKEKDGSITVSHGSSVLAYSPKDDKAHVVYLAGVTAEQYAKDMPKLIKGQKP
ncbi:SCO family protein [Streptomyces synnematoformans]|uniref:SCO family protein n=1 Tax=Streptomyces synnematoformans TaxID=415721 RepID=A0ABN2XPN8_9ACTN